jgi:hypothetical protein
MPHQVPVTIRATLLPGSVGEVERLLREIRAGGPDDERFPFSSLGGVHFARLFVLPGVTDLEGEPIPDSLVYMADVDAPLGRHLHELAAVCGAGLDAVFGGCIGYPDHRNVATRIGWLARHLVKPAATYVHTVGRTVPQVHQESWLRAQIEDLLDRRADLRAPIDASAARARITAAVLDRDDLAWAKRPPKRPGLPYRIRTAIHLVAVPAGTLLLAPILLPAAAVALVAIRLQERREVPESGPVDPAHVQAVEDYEDLAEQNPFTAVGFVKPGRVRRLTMRVALFGLDYTNRHFFARDNLAGVRSIHFARWVPIDDGRRLIFASNYDGSQESYMDDFIDRLAFGLNLVFSNGVGYPRTRWLVLDGARAEIPFKRYLRRHQIPTVVWYSAYDRLPARNIDDNAALRLGLTPAAAEPDEQESAAWLATL